MKLSAKQLKAFRRIQRKHNVSAEFLLCNMPAILRFVHYAITPRPTLMQMLIRRKNRVFLRHNHFRKLVFDASQCKKNRRTKRLRLQWSKRVVMHLKAFKTVEYVEDEVAPETKLHEEDVSKQLKEQLELLKSGKRIVPLLEDAEQKESQSSKTQSPQKEGSCEPVHCDESEAVEGKDIEGEKTSDVTDNVTKICESNGVATELEDCREDASKSANNAATLDESTAPKRPSIGFDRGNGKFLDMLISKVKSTTDDGSDTNLMEPPKKQARTSSDFHNEERENSNSSSDFCGFDDSERIPGTFPGMLSTPLVRIRDSNAPFESETLNAFLRDNSLESSTTMDLPQRPPEDGLVCARTVPPKLDMPALPEGLQGLRTVAERRLFLQRARNVKYCVINNVGTIFRELQKRAKGHRINRNSVEALLNSNTMPLTRASWRAGSWLLTEQGNYYFQTITVDGKDYRLCGSRANSARKFKKPHFNDLDKLSSVCTDSCIDRVTFRALRPIRTLERRSKLSDASTKVIYKACPLSQKILQHSKDNHLAFDSLEVVRMPQVELEVFPQLQKPLNDIAKRYLQLILPYDGISREWAEFSVSTLLEQEKAKLSPGARKSFTFKIPYTNDRDTVLVRRVFSRSEAVEGQFDKSALSFRKEIDEKKAKGETVDALEEECADVLTDMLNSVAISCCENSFIKEDPDNIYQNVNHEEAPVVVEKSAKKSMELHQQQQLAVAGSLQSRKQSRLLMELKRLNATIIDAATSKSDEGGSACEKEICKLGCVCASLSEGTTVRQHCGKQKCILDCNCKCPGIMRLETDGRTITTEDAFMLRRQATAKLARMEKEFTSTIVLTGSETLLINESQYDKKRRCTKVPKRYGDFVDPDESDLEDCKPSRKTEDTHSNVVLEPVMVNERIYQRLKHCTVNIKRCRDIRDLAHWCMIHHVYNCFCRGQATVGNPIVVEKQEEQTGGVTTDETVAAAKSRSLYSFEKEESKAKSKEDTSSNYESESNDSNYSDSLALSALGRKQAANAKAPPKRETISRSMDNQIIESFLNANLNHCRRVVPIPTSTYIRRNKKRVAHVQLFIAENENEQTRLNLSEHVLRSVYYHKTYHNSDKRKGLLVSKKEPIADDTASEYDAEKRPKDQQPGEKRRALNTSQTGDDVSDPKRARKGIADLETGESLLLVNQYSNKKRSVQKMDSNESLTSFIPSSQEQITVPKISQIFSLNVNAGNTVEMGTDSAAAAAADIPKQSTEAAASAGVSSEAFRSVFQVVIRNMNNLVSKKMQDIDMALKRESRSIPVPNDDILCIIRWNNFLTSFLEGFVFLWEVKTANETFLAATVRSVMPFVSNALSVVNIGALSAERLPLLARMLIERTRNSITDCLAVVMQGQKLYWYVKGFLRPDKDRVCPKPTPDTHPLLTKKINVLCRLLINQQINEHKKRQELALKAVPPPMSSPAPSSSPSSVSNTSSVKSRQIELPNHLNSSSILAKLKILPIQRNISDHAAAILEQMVMQAYGAIQTNVVFRKVSRKELFDICQPEKLVLDHHWLVLDISTDFSHIFIPELKDLLTLDRIQKVMSYAVGKKRIVRMQFGQKALFNAYVTPLSRKKLYFGPFRSFNHTPKLILLQSVDGQMMLREVYEKKHNIAERADKTTGLWLIQKRGKVLVDVVSDAVFVPQMGPQEEVHEILDDDVTYVPNTPYDATSPTQVQQNVASNSQKVVDEDDDCVIVEEDLTAPNERIHYTISYADNNSGLLVIQNVAPDGDGGEVENTMDKFTLLEPPAVQPPGNLAQNDQPSSTNPVQIPEQQTPHLSGEEDEQAVQQPCAPLLTEREIVITSVTGADSMADVTNTVPELVPVIASPAPESLTELSENVAKVVDPIASGKEPTSMPSPTIHLSKSVTIRKIPMDPPHKTTAVGVIQRFPSSIDAKSLPTTPVVQNRIAQEAQKPRQDTTTRTKIFPLPVANKQQQQSPAGQIPKVQRIVRPMQKPMIVSKVGSTQICPQRPQVNGMSPQQLPSPQLTVGPQTATPPQGGLIVRTPTAINTYMRNQLKRDIIRPTSNQSTPFSLLKPVSPGTRMRMPAMSSSSTNPSPTPVQVPQKSPKKLDTQPRQIVVKHPLMQGKLVTAANRKQPYLAPQKVQFIRYMNNQPKFVNKLSEATGRPQPNESPQSDPLQITEGSSEAAIGNQLQPQLPSEVKTIRIAHPTLRDKFDATPPSSTSSLKTDGMKRNSFGFLKLASELIGKPSQSATAATNKPATVMTPLSRENSPEFKGIPIDLPRMKKFAIISSPNTTVITPPTTKLIEEYFDDSQPATPNTEPSEKPAAQTHKVIPVATVPVKSAQDKGDALPAINKNLIKVTIPPDSAAATNAKTTLPKSTTQYGYFQANIEGLPKFVVKRINDDFLVKVPNFNGILKLNGLQTVHNYLNQYTAQKCGKTAEEIVKLKWTFKVQDRTRLTNVKSQVQAKPSLNNNVPSSTPALSQTTSTAKATHNSKDVKVKQIDPSPVVLVDDE